ncbi:RabGAP/TBC [Amniculicola lignicola CBS 123094]|uniref:RabGAP/TBC n=1 Tax=Amniculicola lignicola CBS 123094 TaxID=1392246 RepID=A0A6A5W6J6_9PLEO|nr:RabGAP/TBC [Amniculicola lignicola CBS 123094]
MEHRGAPLPRDTAAIQVLTCPGTADPQLATMRTVAEAEKHWRQLDQLHSLTELKISVSSHSEPQFTAGLRSVCWKIFLLFKTLDRATWLNRLSESRTTYESLRASYLRAISHPDEFESSVDPLSEHDESPWIALRADETLRAEIFQDVERCMPDNVYFRQPATQNMMLDILFVFCKMHPHIGYRQGMHEVLAPILWVVERDAVEIRGRESRGVDGTLMDLLDEKWIEHDTFTLFDRVMQTAKTFYAPADVDSNSKDTPMLIRSARIYERLLPKADPALASHLVKLEIVPQIFLLRWIRLLFGREFPLDDVLNVWDALFAIDPTLELVDMISVSMLLRIRWQLIESDTNEAFSLLLRYPAPDSPAYTFIKDALYLRDHLTPEGGAEIISRYGKKGPVIEKALPSIRIPSPSPSFASSRTRNSLASPKAFASPPGGIEALLQGAAKGVLERGSQWGVGKAIRDAVGEVRKNVEALQTGNISGTASGPASGANTPRAGGREYRKPAHISTTPTTEKPPLLRTQSGNIVKKMESLEKRNKGLAKMLESAVGELWDYHKEQTDKPKENQAAVEALSLAIAKVQFVQVYLEDSSIPLPVEDEATTPGLTSPGPTSPPVPERTSSAPPVAASSKHPPATPLTSNPKSPVSRADKPALLSPAPAATPHVPTSSSSSSSSPAPASLSLSPRSRPQLTSSSFSWMLGPDHSTSTSEAAAPNPSSHFASASAHSSFPADEKRRLRGAGKGFLFGDEEEGNVGGNAGGKGKEKRGSVAGREREEEVEEEVIDLEVVGRKGAVR